MRIDWETATEFDTVGFYVARGNSSAGPFAHVSPFIPHTGDTVVGATYVFTDGIPVVNQTYYYRLEVLNTNQTIDYHGPITATAGVPATNTLTPTNTRTATATSTRTRTPTFTPTTQPSTKSAFRRRHPAAESKRRRVCRQARRSHHDPLVVSQPPSPVVFPATPTLASAPANSQPTAPIATSVPPLSNASPLATAVPPPTAATNIVQASAPALVPVEATPGVAAPVVVATEAAPPAAPADSAHGDALVLIVRSHSVPRYCLRHLAPGSSIMSSLRFSKRAAWVLAAGCGVFAVVAIGWAVSLSRSPSVTTPIPGTRVMKLLVADEGIVSVNLAEIGWGDVDSATLQVKHDGAAQPTWIDGDTCASTRRSVPRAT